MGKAFRAWLYRPRVLYVHFLLRNVIQTMYMFANGLLVPLALREPCRGKSEWIVSSCPLPRSSPSKVQHNENNLANSIHPTDLPADSSISGTGGRVPRARGVHTLASKRSPTSIKALSAIQLTNLRTRMVRQRQRCLGFPVLSGTRRDPEGARDAPFFRLHT